jgi:hypothetical protein
VFRKEAAHESGRRMCGVELRQLVEHRSTELDRILKAMRLGIAIWVESPVMEAIQLRDQLILGGFLSAKPFFLVNLLLVQQFEEQKETESFQALCGMQGIIAEDIGDFP